MLRDKSLIPLSHQHQHALALCVRLDRALRKGEIELSVWQAEIEQLFEHEIKIHFAAEESILFPAARQYAALQPLVEELAGEHGVLREDFARVAARTMTAHNLRRFGEQFAAHVRKEERQLFEEMQKLMPPEGLAVVGAELESALKEATQVCAIPQKRVKL